MNTLLPWTANLHICTNFSLTFISFICWWHANFMKWYTFSVFYVSNMQLCMSDLGCVWYVCHSLICQHFTALPSNSRALIRIHYIGFLVQFWKKVLWQYFATIPQEADFPKSAGPKDMSCEILFGPVNLKNRLRGSKPSAFTWKTSLL